MKSEAAPTQRANGAAVQHHPSEDQIAARAYELFVARGAEPGKDLEDWIQAERQLLAEQQDWDELRSMGVRQR